METQRHEMRIIDRTGDTKIVWDRDAAPEVEHARQTFNDMKKKGYYAYAVTGKNGEKGELMQEFDPMAEKMILAPRMAGG